MQVIKDRRWLRVVLLAVIGGLVLVPAVLAARPTAFPASTPRCLTSNLRVDKIGQVGFTSHRSWDLALRNIGATTCHLNGFPRVRLLDSGARPMPTTVSHVAGPAHAVVLRPFHRAFFSFTFVVSGPCPAAVFSYGVRITPPHASQRLVWYAGKFDLCGPGPPNVSVSPVKSSRPF
jgi:Protein of unknown function (DUF4232)